MVRQIPKWIGNVAVPETRTTTEQLLFCWAQLVDEIANVKPLLRKLSDKMTEQSFILQAQEISMHLSGVLKEKGFKQKCEGTVYMGHPETPTGIFNANVATVLHGFFDEPDMKFKKPCRGCEGEA